MGEWKEKKNRAPDLKYLERESLKKGDSDTGTAADVELVMKKYDRESNTRVCRGNQHRSSGGCRYYFPFTAFM